MNSRIVAAIGLCSGLFLTSCQSNHKMTGVDRAFASKSISKQADGSTKITISGTTVSNPVSALETLHAFADKEMGGRPYRVSYNIGKMKSPQPSSDGPLITPGMSMGLAMDFGGGGFLEGAAIGAAAALINELYQASQKDSGKPKPQSIVDNALGDIPIGLHEKHSIFDTLRISGTVTPISPITLDRGRPVEIIVPSPKAIIGSPTNEQCRDLANTIRGSFESRGFQAFVTNGSPQRGGYAVRCQLLRFQGTAITYSGITFEATISDTRRGSELTRFIVEGSEKPFDLATQQQRLAHGVAIRVVEKPMATKLSQWVK